MLRTATAAGLRRWAIVLAALSGFAATAGHANTERADAQLKRAMQGIGQSRLESSLEEIDRLIARYPNFRLALLVRGDLLLARTGRIASLGNTGHAALDRLAELRAEAQARVRAGNRRPPPGLLPRYLLQLGPGQKHAVVVDASESRVYVFEDAGGTPRLVDDFYGTLGRSGVDKQREGDRKTPIGVYHVVSRIPGRKLPDLYGWGAFPINYPNEWDRLRGKTGYGIWLHGVPSDTYARAPLASDGCVALANPDMEELAKRVQVGKTPVILAQHIEWTAPGALRAEREAFMRHLEAWIADWQSLDAGRYLQHYSGGFRSEGMDLAGWTARKRRVNAAKQWIKVSLSNVSAFRDPGLKQGLVAVTFDQDYRSSNLAQRTRKRQYWVEDGGRWRIAYEGPVGATIVARPESYPEGRR